MTNQLKPGLQSTCVDGAIIGFDEDACDLIENCLGYGEREFKVWNQKRRSLKPASTSPMRVVQFKDCDWTLFYFVDGREASDFTKLITDGETLIDFSLNANGGAMIVLDLADTGDVYNLREYQMGDRERCLATDVRQFRGSRFESICQRTTLDDIDTRLKELNFVYSQVEDGGRAEDGAILPLREVEPYIDQIARQYLLV